MSRASLVLLYPIFFISGAAALIFEALWFHQAGLAFGNSLWASALVLSSFMAGLGLGNGLAALCGAQIRSPLVLYALLECIVGSVGLVVVLGLPASAPLLSRILGPLMDSGWPLQFMRFAAGFLVLLAPAVGMGATLPLLVQAMTPDGTNFGQVLGRLYGTNTLGAMFGAATVELIWIPILGIRGSALFAAFLLSLAALLALGLSRRWKPLRPPLAAPDLRPLGWRGLALLTATFLSGLALLGLEVLWFRLLQLFTPPTAEVFALMLATVLLGIGVGSHLAAIWLRFRDAAQKALPAVALTAGVVALYTYRVFPNIAARSEAEPLSVLPLCSALILPTATLSGALFTLIGEALQKLQVSSLRAAGLLTFANTMGSMLGPLVAGFLLLPFLGLETSMLALSLVYAGVAVFSALGSGLRELRWRPAAVVAAIFAWMIVSFPQGSSQQLYQEVFLAGPTREDQLVAVREEPHQIAAYLRRDFAGDPYFFTLATDTISMAASHVYSRRYMSLFALLPRAFHPALRDAVLISYGVGITARALADQPELERIDVVDISEAILEMGSIPLAGDTYPLRDPRMHVHVEDGRHFLQTTQRRYDLVTAEPPPPAAAGVVNLYTREYFELLHDRLRDGGIATYWLPVNHMISWEAKAITKAFCQVFPDCSLWDGAGGDWILMGTRGEMHRMSEEEIRRSWVPSPVATTLHEIGLERAEQLATLFLADSAWLLEWVGDVPPLVDNWPRRAPRWRPMRPLAPEFLRIMDSARARFERSAWIAARFPRSFRVASLPYFEYQKLTNQAVVRLTKPAWAPLGVVHRVLEDTSLEALPLWLLGSDALKQGIAARRFADGDRSDPILYERALGALAGRDFEAAVSLMETRASRDGSLEVWLYALCQAGRREQAQDAIRSLDPSQISRPNWAFLEFTFDLRLVPGFSLPEQGRGR